VGPAFQPVSVEMEADRPESLSHRLYTV